MAIVLLRQRVDATEELPDADTLFGYDVVEGREVVAAFDGGEVTSDAGGLLLGGSAAIPNSATSTVASCSSRSIRPATAEIERW